MEIPEYSDEVKQKLKLVNGILRSVGVPPLFENEYFIFDSKYASFHGIRFSSETGGDNFLPIDLYLESDSIRIDILDIPESFEWSNKMLANSQDSIANTFTWMLTGFSVLEYCGSPHTNSRLYIFSTEGHQLTKLVIRGWFNLFSRWQCERHLFFPKYPS
jgi:hypothetical protein